MSGGPRRLVLASASPARLALLRASGFDPVVRVSRVDEAALTAEHGPQAPADVALLLARAKAADVAALLAAPSAVPSAVGAVAETADGAPPLVLGCDSVLELDGTAYGKPASPSEVHRRWRTMAGRTGTLHTGHSLVDVATGREAAAVGSTEVTFGEPDAEELDRYVATGEPLAVAGAFTLDGLGAPLVTGVRGCPGNVVGVSPPLLRALLRGLGVPLTAVWPRAAGDAP